MSSVTVTYRVLDHDPDTGSIYYHLTDQAEHCDIDSGITLRATEWDDVIARINIPRDGHERIEYLRTAGRKIESDIRLISRIIKECKATEPRYTLLMVVNRFSAHHHNIGLKAFATEYINERGTVGKALEKIESPINSLLKFLNVEDIALDRITPDTIAAYESHLSRRNISHTSAYTYLIALRSLYNKAVQAGLVADRQPFAASVVLNQQCTTSTRPKLSDANIDAISKLDLTHDPELDFARDLLLLIRYSGLSLIKLATLRKTYGTYQYGGIEGYRQSEYHPNEAAAQILKKYDTQSPYCLPIMDGSSKATPQSRATVFRHTFAKHLKKIAQLINLPFDLNYYSIAVK